MVKQQIIDSLQALNARLAHQLGVEERPLDLITQAEYAALPEQEREERRPLVIEKNGITWYQAQAGVDPEEMFEEATPVYSRQPGTLADLFTDHYTDVLNERKQQKALVFLGRSPAFWSARTALSMPAGPIPIGRMLQNLITLVALLLLVTAYFFRHSSLLPPKPVALYMSICFVLALSSIARIGELWDDHRFGQRLRPDFSQQLGFLLALLVPCYYYATLSHSLLEKPLQYTLLSTTAAAVCMSFFNNPKS